MEIKKSPKVAKKFKCSKCHYICCKESDYKKHIGTRKHLKNENGNEMEILEIKKNIHEFKCLNCEKKYSTNSGLWKHKKNCVVATITRSQILYNTTAPENLEITQNSQLNTLNTLINDNEEFKKIILEIVQNNSELQKQNQDLQKQMLEVCKNGGGNNNTIHSHNNNNNKTFNLQFFLNEQCKDAMNLSDFIDTFQLEFSDLEKVGKLGYVDGISDIIIKKLNDMDIYKRPIHCSDLKREIVYIKADNVWSKEDSTHSKLRRAIKQISKKNYDMIPDWSKANPNSQICDHYMNNVYISMVSNALGLRGGGGLEENENKIIKKINKMVLIEK